MASVSVIVMERGLSLVTSAHRLDSMYVILCLSELFPLGCFYSDWVFLSLVVWGDGEILAHG